MSSGIASSAAVGPPPGMEVRLSSNESSFGPSPQAVAAAKAAVDEAHLYPDDQSVALRQAIADHEGVAIEKVAVGTGSAALLMDAVPHECRDGGSVLAYERTFVVFRLAARNAGADYVEVPDSGPATLERNGYQRDPEALLDRVDGDTRMVVVDNPGNPTNAHLTGDQLTRLVSALPEHVTILVDEAYHHFATGLGGYATVSELGLDHPRLLVTRTFSKAHALAGLRIGYVVGPAELVTSLDSWRTRFNVTSPAQRAATASLADTDHLDMAVTGTREGRERMAAGLRELGVPFTDGLGNFLTVELGEPADAVVEHYGKLGVGVRALAPYGMGEQIRVTVGTRDEVTRFLEASSEVLAGVASRG